MKILGLWFHTRIEGTTSIFYLPSSYNSLSLQWTGAGLLLCSCPCSAVYLAGLWRERLSLLLPIGKGGAMDTNN